MIRNWTPKRRKSVGALVGFTVALTLISLWFYTLDEEKHSKQTAKDSVAVGRNKSEKIADFWRKKYFKKLKQDGKNSRPDSTTGRRK